MSDYCIVIPVYKETLDCVEEISLKRLYKVLIEDEMPSNMDDYRYWTEPDVYLVYPEGMDISEYKKIYPSLLEKTFDPKYFKSTATYSQLCISYDFYNRFKSYEYMLIYQLDCYIFKDEISEWCNKGYDYIGGPILSTDCGWDTVKKSRQGKEQWTPYVGNGGLSLRKISTFMDITNPNGELMQTYFKDSDVLKNVIFEDKFFCNDLFNIYDLEVPNWIEACNFALDMSVDVVYDIFKMNPQPMGIHSVDKNIRWWKKIIPEFGDKKVIDYCEKKNADFFKLYYDENDSTYRVK